MDCLSNIGTRRLYRVEIFNAILDKQSDKVEVCIHDSLVIGMCYCEDKEW